MSWGGLGVVLVVSGGGLGVVLGVSWCGFGELYYDITSHHIIFFVSFILSCSCFLFSFSSLVFHYFWYIFAKVLCMCSLFFSVFLLVFSLLCVSLLLIVCVFLLSFSEFYFELDFKFKLCFLGWSWCCLGVVLGWSWWCRVVVLGWFWGCLGVALGSFNMT